jgi:hypothetical protein
MSNQTPLNDLLTLKTPADEVEISPDDGMDREPGEIVETPQPAVQTPAATTDPKTQQHPAQAATATPDPATPADDGTSTQGLPKAFHARVKAADERKRAAEERAANYERQFQTANSKAEQAARELDEAKKKNAEWAAWYEDQTGRPVPGAQPDQPRQQQPDLNATLSERDYKIRADFGYRLSVRDNGKETTDQAALWAQDRAASDRGFYQQITSAPDPVAFAVEEFRKAQVQDELAQYGYDLDKLVAARAGKTTPQTQPQVQQQSPATQQAAPRQPAHSMPSDFASQPSGGARAEPVFPGPKPLGELLKIRR